MVEINLRSTLSSSLKWESAEKRNELVYNKNRER